MGGIQFSACLFGMPLFCPMPLVPWYLFEGMFLLSLTERGPVGTLFICISVPPFKLCPIRIMVLEALADG
jgi:hypothetical protein